MQLLTLEPKPEPRAGAEPTARKPEPAVPATAVAGDLTPKQTAEKLVEWSLAKPLLSTDRMIVLGLMAGLFIAFGGALFTAVMAEMPLAHGPARLLGGIAFAMGLLLVCMTGAELSTGNCLMVTAWAEGRLGVGQVRRVLAVSYAANAAGALALVLVMARTGLFQAAHGQVAAAIAEAKLNLSFEQAFWRGTLCNALVCLAVWLILAGRTITSKFLGLVFPIGAFVAMGFEHSIANLYLLPAGILAGARGAIADVLANLLAVTLGNLAGGAAIALTFWAVHVRAMSPTALPARE